MDYAKPRASDLCAVAIKSKPVPTKPTKINPQGVKGAGEAGTVGAMPAVANALVDALSEFGGRHIEMPATAEVIWRAMRDMGMEGLALSKRRSTISLTVLSK
jgi:carbon-monoxide dehydrogenase large subunit